MMMNELSRREGQLRDGVECTHQNFQKMRDKIKHMSCMRCQEKETEGNVRDNLMLNYTALEGCTG